MCTPTRNGKSMEYLQTMSYLNDLWLGCLHHKLKPSRMRVVIRIHFLLKSKTVCWMTIDWSCPKMRLIAKLDFTMDFIDIKGRLFSEESFCDCSVYLHLYLMSVACCFLVTASCCVKYASYFDISVSSSENVMHGLAFKDAIATMLCSCGCSFCFCFQ